MRAVILSLLLLSLPASAIQSRSITIAQDTDTDSRCFAAYLKQPIPDFEIDEEDSISFDLKNYYAAGDDNVTNSPKCTDVAPTIVAGGNAVTGLALNTTDLDNATYGGTTTTSSAGTGTLTLTFDNSISTSVVDSIGWTVNDSGTPAVDPPMPATAYCVSSVGNDSASGRFPNCWRTLNKVNGFTFSSGDDVYLRAGDTFADQTLTVDWGGISSNRVVIGTYYVSSSQPFILQPSNPTAAAHSYTYSSGNRAEINGTYDASCSDTLGGTGLCPWNTAGAVPASGAAGLVTVSADYVTIQDLHIRNASGYGVNVPRVTSGVGRQHVWVLRNRIQQNSSSAILFQTTNRAIARGNHISQVNLQGRSADFRQVTWGGAINVTDNRLDNPAYALIENNTVYDTYGEGIGLLKASYSIVRGNHVGEAHSAAIYMDNSGSNVIEYNDIWGGGPEDTDAGTNITVGMEPYPSASVMQSSNNNVIRGNMVAHTGWGVNFSIFTTCTAQCGSMPLDLGLTVGALVYNNTFVEHASEGFRIGANIPSAGVDYIEAKNNIIYSTRGGSTPCTSPTFSAGKFVKSNNLWTSTPDSDCSGTGDVIGNPTLTGTNWTTKFYPSQPTTSDYVLQAGSPALAVGADLDSAILTAGQVPQSGAIEYPCATFDLEGSITDAVCAARHATTPDLGALERP